MTFVVGTAGHIDHGKTALLRALTGIDADRLPDERRRGMTIDVGYAHMTVPGGGPDGVDVPLDFVDVPGHDRLVGNMLVGAGEIDAAMLVVAADEGPQAQTHEHLGLLDALGIDEGLVVLTKLDLLEPDDPRRRLRPDELRALLAPTSLSGAQIVAVSAVSGEGLDTLRVELAHLIGRLAARGHLPGGPRLAIDRVFVARGRGVVVTGSLRGGPLSRGQAVRLEPGGRSLRIREAQVHGGAVETTPGAGRVALNLAGVERGQLRRGMALVAGPAVRATDRLLVALRPSASGRALSDGVELRVHLGTADVLARLRLAGRVSDSKPEGELLGALVLAEPIPAALDDRFVLRWPSPAATAAGGRVIDAAPPARLIRRRLDRLALARLAADSGPATRFRAMVEAHHVLDGEAAEAIIAMLGGGPGDDGVVRLGGRYVVARLFADAEDAALTAVAAGQATDPQAPGVALATARTAATRALRRGAPGAGLSAADGAEVIEGLVARGALVRAGDLVRTPEHRPNRPPALQAAMERLAGRLSVPAPPSLWEAARDAGCPAEGIRALEAEGRIVRLDADLAYATETFADLEARAVELARRGPLSPAAFRDATGTSRKYALAVLEELDGRGVLRRGPEGHVLGPKAPPG